ncbi:MAG: hypothetical protein H7Z40_05680 [Phycisphaerae bacterium]|nr:hypothetical protein [Gemmatimonadaceae bacterium]
MRARISKISTPCAMVLALTMPSMALAQNNGNKSDQKACDNAAKIIAKGHPEKKEADAYLTLIACGAVGANAYASGIANIIHDTNTAELNDFMRQVDNWRDSTIMVAVTNLALNAAASPQARVFAVRHLVTLVEPFRNFSYLGLTMGDVSRTEADGSVITTTGCRASMGSEKADLTGAPLPANYAVQIRNTIATLVTAPATPTLVRNAARCLP